MKPGQAGAVCGGVYVKPEATEVDLEGMDSIGFVVKTKRIAAWVVPLIVVGTLISAVQFGEIAPRHEWRLRDLANQSHFDRTVSEVRKNRASKVDDPKRDHEGKQRSTRDYLSAVIGEYFLERDEAKKIIAEQLESARKDDLKATLAPFAAGGFWILSFLLGLGWLIGVAPCAFRASRRIGRGVAVETVHGAMGSRKLVIAAKTGVAKWGRGVVDEAKRGAEKDRIRAKRKVKAPTRRDPMNSPAVPAMPRNDPKDT